MEHAPSLARPFPWRTATIVVGVLAAVELVALALVGGTRLAHFFRPVTHTPAAAAAPAAHRTATHVKPLKLPAIPSHPLLPRSRVSVLVLNGNGVTGAAGTEAARLQARGYALPTAKDAARHDYARSMVLFASGLLRRGAPARARHGHPPRLAGRRRAARRSSGGRRSW